MEENRLKETINRKKKTLGTRKRVLRARKMINGSLGVAEELRGEVAGEKNEQRSAGGG